MWRHFPTISTRKAHGQNLLQKKDIYRFPLPPPKACLHLKDSYRSEVKPSEHKLDYWCWRGRGMEGGAEGWRAGPRDGGRGSAWQQWTFPTPEHLPRPPPVLGRTSCSGDGLRCAVSVSAYVHMPCWTWAPLQDPTSHVTLLATPPPAGCVETREISILTNSYLSWLWARWGRSPLVTCGTALLPWKPSLRHEHRGHCTWYCPLLIAVTVKTSIVCHPLCVFVCLRVVLEERIKEWNQKLQPFPGFLTLLIIMYRPPGLSRRRPILFSFFPVFLFNCLSLCCQFPAHSTGLKSTFILQLLTQTGYCSAPFSSPVPSRFPALCSSIPSFFSDPAQN